MFPSLCRARIALEFREDLFDRVEIGTAMGRQPGFAAMGAEQFTGCRAFVRGEIVADHDVPGAQLAEQLRAQVSKEQLGVHRPVHDKGRAEPVMPQGRYGRAGLVVAVGNTPYATLVARRPSIVARHLGVQPRLIDEDQLCCAQFWLGLPPLLACLFHVGALLFGGVQRFFIGKVQPGGLMPERMELDLHAQFRAESFDHLGKGHVIFRVDPCTQGLQVGLEPGEPPSAALEFLAASGLPESSPVAFDGAFAHAETPGDFFAAVPALPGLDDSQA